MISLKHVGFIFLSANRIILRAQTSKLTVSADRQFYIEKSVAYHLGQLKRAFLDGDLDENCVENADETHFVFNMDNGKTLGFIGNNQVKYADVVSGGESITMVVRITGGQRAAIQPPMLIFKNLFRSYPIRGVPDSMPGVFYSTSPKAWMRFCGVIDFKNLVQCAPCPTKNSAFCMSTIVHRMGQHLM